METRKIELKKLERSFARTKLYFCSSSSSFPYLLRSKQLERAARQICFLHALLIEH